MWRREKHKNIKPKESETKMNTQKTKKKQPEHTHGVSDIVAVVVKLLMQHAVDDQVSAVRFLKLWVLFRLYICAARD